MALSTYPHINGVNLSKITLPADSTKLDELNKKFKSNPHHSDIEYLKTQGCCIDSWISEKPSKIYAADNYNYILPVVLEDNIANNSNKITYLSGGVCEVPSTGGSEELKSHIQLAKKIIEYVDKTVPFSANYPQRSRIFRLHDDIHFQSKMFKIINKGLTDLRKNLKSTGSCLEKEDELAKEYKIGNCDELSIVGYQYGQSLQSNENQIEIFKILNGDHVFLVIGRDKRSLVHDFSKWGPSSVVCDVWTGACYPGTEIENHLLNYIGLIEIGNIHLTKVEKFNPNKHSLIKHPAISNNLAQTKNADKVVSEVLIGDGSNFVTALLVSEEMLYSGYNDGSIKKWDLKSLKCISTHKGHSEKVTALAIADDILISGSNDGMLFFWNEKTQKMKGFLIGHKSSVTALSVDPITMTLTSVSTDSMIKTWDLNALTCTNALTLEGKITSFLILSNRVIFGYSNGEIDILNAKTQEWEAYKEHKSAVTSLVYFNGMLISGSEDSTIRVQDLETRKHLHILKKHTSAITSLKIVNQTLISTSLDGSFRYWDTKKWSCKDAFEENEKNPITTLAVTNKQLVMGTEKGILVTPMGSV